MSYSAIVFLYARIRRGTSTLGHTIRAATPPLSTATGAFSTMDLADKERLIAHELEDAKHLLAFDLARFSPHVRACLDVIHAHVFDPELSVGAVYERSAVNSHTVGLQFRQELDVGMREYIENARLLAAMRLLAHDDLELHLIASSVGYMHYETFSRAFKRRVGHAPSAFRAVHTISEVESSRQKTTRRKDQHISALRSRDSMQRPSAPPASTTSGQATLPSQPISHFAGAIMQITDVRGSSSDNHTLDSLEVEGRAPDADKVQVTIEVTGKTLSKTVSVRKDETWSVSFKGTGKTDLSGFACGALVSTSAVASGDQTQHVSWKGCLPCGSKEDAEGSEQQAQDESDSAETSDRSPQDERSSRGRVYQSEGGEPLVVVEQHASDSGDALVTVRVAESSEAVAYRTVRQDESHDRAPHHGDRAYTERGSEEAVSQRTERPDETRLAPKPEKQDHATDEPRDARRKEAQQREDEEDDGTPMWLGGLLALAEAGFLVAVTAQSYPLILGAAAAFMLVMTAFFFASQPPRSWALWTFGGLGLAAVAIAGMLPFFEFIGFDIYLLSAGLAAAGLAAGAGFLMFASGDEEADA